MKYFITLLFLYFSTFTLYSQGNTIDLSEEIHVTKTYQDLVMLFKTWRAFEEPSLRKGAPDYTAETFEKRRPEFERLRVQLKGIDTTAWSNLHQVDWIIVWAEMNGYDFNQCILKPWARDSAFYRTIWSNRSDVRHMKGRPITQP